MGYRELEKKIKQNRERKSEVKGEENTLIPSINRINEF